MTRIIVCRLGEEPKVEEVDQPFDFCKTNLVKGGYIEAKTFWLEEDRVIFYWEEDAKPPVNRYVPAISHYDAGAGFVIDTREHPPEAYAKPGELGVFPIKGNFLVTRADKEGDHVSLSDAQVNELMKLLALPKCEKCKTATLAYPGARFCGSACSAAYEMKIDV